MAGDFFEAFAELEYSVRTGRSGYERHFGVPHFEHITRDPIASATARAGQAADQAQAAAFLAECVDFVGVTTLVDLGGAQGHLLAALLRRHPAMRGVLFDTPDRLAGAADVMREAGVADRAELVAFDGGRLTSDGGLP